MLARRLLVSVAALGVCGVAACALAACALAACDRSASSPPPAPADPVATARTASLAPPVGRGATSPSLVTVGDGLLLTWIEPAAGAGPGAGTERRVRFARHLRGGWTAPVTIAQGPGVLASGADVPSVAQARDGTLVAHWAERAGGPGAHGYGVEIGRSIDAGATWQRLGAPHRDRTDTEHGFVSLVPDGDAILALWLDGRATAGGAGGATALRAARIGEAIGDDQPIDDRVCDCCSTAAVATPGGPLAVYRDRSADELRDVALVRRAGAAWTAPHPVHADGWRLDGCPVNGPRIAAADREVAVAWYTRAGERPSVRIAFSRDAGGTFEPPIEIDVAHGDLAPAGHVDLALAGAGEAIVSWVASTRDATHLRLGRVARDGRRGGVLELAALPAARGSVFPRMARLGDGVVVAWTDDAAGTVRVERVALSDVPPLASAARDEAR